MKSPTAQPTTEKTSNLIIYIADKREDIYRITENHDTEVKDGIAYLGYAFVKWTKGKGFVWKKPYYIPVLGGKGTYFAIKFIFRRFDAWKRYRNAIEASLWLLSHFGGLGARTRRGFGSIRCRDIDSSWLDWSYSCDDQYFRKNLEKIQKEFINLASVSSPSGTDEFTTFSNFKCIIGQKDWQNWEEALNEVGRFFRKYRETNQKSQVKKRQINLTNDYVNVVTKFMNGALLPSKRSDFVHDAFGLPMQYTSYHRKTKATLTWRERVNGRWAEKDRRASPLFLRILKCSDNRYKSLAAFFNSKFLPEGSIEILKSLDKNGPKPVEVQGADTTIIVNFLEAFEKTFKGQWITL